MLRIPHCVDNRLRDGCKVVSPTHRMRSTSQKHYCSASGTHFCARLSETQDLVRLEELGKFGGKKTFHLNRYRTRDLSACKHSALTNTLLCALLSCVANNLVERSFSNSIFWLF
jgi:hypothetical protein